MGKKLTREEFIEKAIAIHGEKYDYSKVEYVDAITKVIIGCNEPTHEDFEQSPDKHLLGHGCNKCGRKSAGYALRSNIKEFIKKARAVHGDKYDYSKVEYINNYTKVIIGCDDPEHEDFEQTPSNHLNGNGCKRCSHEFNSNESRMTMKEFIKKARAVHGEKYDYSKVKYVNNKTKAIIGCDNPEHEDFPQTPSAHLQGHGCNECGGSKKSTTEEFIKKAIAIHGDKYDYSKVKYVDAFTKVIIGCNDPEHGDYEQSPNNHLSGNGCDKCGGSFKLTTKEFIRRAIIVHGKKYDYSKVKYVDSRTKIIIICKKDGKFLQTPAHHLQGSGCKKCHDSKGEIGIESFLNNFNIKFEPQKKFDDCRGIRNKLPFDFYLSDYNLCIEYDGRQHFEPFKKNERGYKRLKNAQRTDQIKTDYCKNNNINLLRIPYTKFKNIEEILIKELNLKIYLNS